MKRPEQSPIKTKTDTKEQKIKPKHKNELMTMKRATEIHWTMNVLFRFIA